MSRMEPKSLDGLIISAAGHTLDPPLGKDGFKQEYRIQQTRPTCLIARCQGVEKNTRRLKCTRALKSGRGINHSRPARHVTVGSRLGLPLSRPPRFQSRAAASCQVSTFHFSFLCHSITDKACETSTPPQIK